MGRAALHSASAPRCLLPQTWERGAAMRLNSNHVALAVLFAGLTLLAGERLGPLERVQWLGSSTPNAQRHNRVCAITIWCFGTKYCANGA
jgi:hypothetical protein